MSRRKFSLNWQQALAEIALIFVGITLAVTFQNWNENRKDGILKSGYYDRLLAEVKQDIFDIEAITQYNKVRLESILKFFKYLDENTRPSPDSIQQYVEDISYHMNSYVPNENTYQELISTGNIKLLNTDIRERLLRLSQMHAYVDRTQQSFMQRYDNRRDQMAEVIDESVFYEIRKRPDAALVKWQRNINSEGFKRYSNLLAVRVTIANTLIEIYGSLKGQCEELVDQIEATLAD